MIPDPECYMIRCVPFLNLRPTPQFLARLECEEQNKVNRPKYVASLPNSAETLTKSVPLASESTGLSFGFMNQNINLA